MKGKAVTCDRSRMESSPFAQPKASKRAFGASARVVISAEPVAAAVPCTCLILVAWDTLSAHVGRLCDQAEHAH